MHTTKEEAIAVARKRGFSLVFEPCDTNMGPGYKYVLTRDSDGERWGQTVVQCPPAVVLLADAARRTVLALAG